MEKINFENLPNTSTPINADNLNTMQKNMEQGIEQLKNDMLDIIYPVGSIYISFNSINPTTLFGGNWEQIKDVFLLSAGDTYNEGETGGEATHKLTINEMPRHNHSYSYNAQTTGISTMAIRLTDNSKINSYTGTEDGFSGGNEAHNNMPPYLVVYMWKRIS